MCVCVKQLWPLRPACSQNRAGSCICRIRLPSSFSVPFFQRRHGSYCAKPTRIQSGWRGQGLAKHTWSGCKLVYRNQQARFLAGTQPARYRFHTFRRSSTDVSDNIVQHQPGSDFSSGRLCRVLAKRIRSGSKPMCKNHPARLWPMRPSRSGPDANRIRHVYWEVTYHVTR